MKWPRRHKHIMPPHDWPKIWEDAGNGMEVLELHCLDATCYYVEKKYRKKKDRRRDIR